MILFTCSKMSKNNDRTHTFPLTHIHTPTRNFQPTLGLSEWSRWRVNAGGCPQEAGLAQICCRATPPLRGSTAGCDRGPPRTGLNRTCLRLRRLRSRCSPVPLWHSCLSRHGCSFPFLRCGFLCAAMGRSRHQGRRELWRESRDRGHNLGPGRERAGSGLRVLGG